MAKESFLAQLYYAIEDAYYSAMSAVNKVVPVYKYFIVPVERSGLPSMVVLLFLIGLIGAGAFVYANYGGELGPALQEKFSSLNFNIEFPSGGGTVGAVSLSFSVEDEKGRPVNAAQVSLSLDGEVLAQGATVNGEIVFDDVPAQLLSYSVSRQGYRNATGEIDASKRRSVIVTLECGNGGCPVTPTAKPTLAPTPTATQIPLPHPLNKRTLRVTLLDSSGAPLIARVNVTAKDAVDLSVVASAQASIGVADLQDLVVGSNVFIQADSAGYSQADSGQITLSDFVFDTGLELRLSRAPGQPTKTRIVVVDSANASLVASVSVFESGKVTPFLTGATDANGTYEISLDSVKQWFVLVNKTGYAPNPYATANFRGGEHQLVVLNSLVNQTLQYCRVEVSGSDFGVGEPVQVRVIYANLTAPPSNVTVFCGVNSTQRVIVSTCLNTTGNCTAQCSYDEPGSKALYAQISDLNCLSTSAVAINVTTRGPYCSISLLPQSISSNGSTIVQVSYSNLSSAPVAGILYVNCGAGGAGNVVGAVNCSGTTGNCTATCRYSFSPSQVLDNPTRPIFVSYGGAQCIRDVHFADTASSLETIVVFRTRLLSNARVALYKPIVGQQPVFYAASSAPSGKATFSQLVRGDSFVVKASDGSGIMQGAVTKFLDLPVNTVNVSVDLPAGYFNATALDASTRTITASLASANVIFSAFCNDLAPDGRGYTSSYLAKGTCTAVNGSCILPASAFVSCFVNGSAANLVDASASTFYSIDDANGTLAVERLFSHCGARSEACCSNAPLCSSGLSCSRQVCTDPSTPTAQFSVTGSAGVITTSAPEIVFKTDAVFAADAVPLTVSLDSGCAQLNAEISGDSGVVPCFNDVAAQPTQIVFDSSSSGCLVKSSGLSMPNSQATLSLSCGGTALKTSVRLKVVGSYSQDSAQYAPPSISSSGSANLFYVVNQKQLEGQLLEVAQGVVSPSQAFDSQPPSINISSPAPGSVVTGPVELVASAQDDRRVERVSFFVDGSTQPFKILFSPPYAAVWDASNASVTSGQHTLIAQARDAMGNTASTSIIVSKRLETTVLSGIVGLNNIVFDSSKIYYAFSGGIGVHSASCPDGCIEAQWVYPGQPLSPLVAVAPTSLKYFLAYQNYSTGESRLLVKVGVPNEQGGTDFVLSNLSQSLSSPVVFADSSNAFFHSGSNLLKSDSSSVSTVGSLSLPLAGFGYDAGSIYIAYNTPTGGKIAKKAFSDGGSTFTTIASPSDIVRSIVAKDGWVYWLQDSPGRICKVLSTGVGAPYCAPVALSHPSSLATDPAGTALYFLDGTSVKRISTDWSGQVTLATGLSSPKNIAVDTTSVYFAVIDSTGRGVIKKVPKDP